MSSSITDIDTWKYETGLFPCPLNVTALTDENKYVLLNGGPKGNFCLDFNPESPEISRQNAWSSDVSHYVTLHNDTLRVYRWDKKTFQDEVSIEKVYGKIDKFYTYLKSQNVDQSNSFVNFGINLYKHIRTVLRDNAGADSLNALLFLLACSSEKVSINGLDLDKWGIDPQVKSLVSSINTITWDSLLDRLDKGSTHLDLKPNISLVLRHASGHLFQEAHFESVFPIVFQGTLPGFERIEEHKLQPVQQSSHFTPTSIVRTVVEEVLFNYDFQNRKKITILDPACGSGEFLKEAVRQSVIKGYSGEIEIIGWDLSKSAINLAKFILNFDVKNLPNISIKTECKDALQNAWEPVDIILMNPPFISWELMKEAEKEAVKTTLDKFSGSRPNIAGAFLWKAVQALKTGGKIGCVLPASLLEADSFRELRKELRSMLSIEFLGKLGNHIIYSNAVAYTSLLVAQKNVNPENQTLIMWSDTERDSYSTALRELRKIKTYIAGGDQLIKGVNKADYSIYHSDTLNDNNWTPIKYSSFRLNEKLKHFPRVKDLFDVKQGARTGLNEAFIITKTYWKTLSQKERKFFRPVVTNDSINHGALNDGYYIFYTEGVYTIKTEKELKKVIPQFWEEKFKYFAKQLSIRGQKEFSDYWRLTRHRAWQVEYVPKIVSKEFGKAGGFAFDKDGKFIAERSHAWLPKLKNNWNNVAYGYIAILSMDKINDLLNGISKQLGGGYYSLASKYINDMPIPNLFDESIDDSVKEELISIGMELSDGEYSEELQLKLNELSRVVFNV